MNEATEESELRTIGKYQILGPLGRGSMGLVYKARDPEIGRQVAIKTLRKLLPTHVQSADLALERFRNEARSAGNLRHPNIITIFEVNRDGDTPYIVMDYVEGQSLESVLANEKKLQPERMLHYLSQVAEGLDYAHSKGVIHKDIKPGNIFVDRSHNVFILDFGIASIQASMPEEGIGSPALGTPGYMSPEQIMSEKIDNRSDLFSLAIVAFECLAGVRPFPGATFTEVIGNILNAKPTPLTQLVPNLPLALEAEFDRALAKERSRRFASAREMIEAFAKALGAVQTPGKGYWKETSEGESNWQMLNTGDAADSAGGDSAGASNGSGPRPSGLHGKPGGWPQEENPGDLFQHGDEPLVSAVLNQARSPVQILTFILGAVAVVMGVVLVYVLYQPAPPPPPPPQPVEGAVEEREPPQPAGDLVVPSVEKAPAGLPVSSLNNKQILGILMDPAAPEGLLIDALHEAQTRKIPQLVDASVRALDHDSYVVRIETIKMLAAIGDRRIVPRLMLSLDDHDPLVRTNAAKALGTLGDRGSLGYLTQKMLSEEVPEVKAAMKAAIEKINGFPLKDLQ